MNMNIAYTSDLHLDFHVSSVSNFKKTENFISKLIKNKNIDILILAGDISHYNTQIIDTCKFLNENDIKVVLTFGNHELYNVSNKQRQQYKKLYSKVNNLKTLLNALDDTYFLDGDVIEINGIKFGGACGWYDGSYYYKISQGMYTSSIEIIWQNYMNDARFIPEIKDFYEIFNIEIKKIKNVLKQKPDIMISHVCPISEEIVFSDKHKTDKLSGFYCFDGIDLIDVTNAPKYWVYGHIHDFKEFKIYNTKFLRNPLGYPGDNPNFDLKFI